jgi:hypothetical protein
MPHGKIIPQNALIGSGVEEIEKEDVGVVGGFNFF